MREEFRELHLYITGRLAYIQAELAEVVQSERQVEAMVSRLENDRAQMSRNPRADTLLGRILRAASDPGFQRMEARMSQDQAALLSQLSGRTLPRPLPTPGQLTLSQFNSLIEQDHRDHPEHWGGDFPRT